MSRYYACVEFLIDDTYDDRAHERLVENLATLEESGAIVNFQFKDWDKPWHTRGALLEVPETYDFPE